MNTLEWTIGPVNLVDALIASGIALGIFALLVLAQRVLLNRWARFAEGTSNSIDDDLVIVLRRTQWWFLLVVGVSIGTLYFDLPAQGDQLIRSATVLALLLQAGLWSSTFLVQRLERYRLKRRETDPGSEMTLSAVGFLGRIALWSFILLLALDNLGVNVTALIAGLGVGGIAVALAVQNILGDLFASLSIVLDKPFTVGDFLIIDDLLGKVEHVGLKTTRLRSLSGEQLVFSNSDLLQSRIRNYGRMYERRVVFEIGVTYQTPRDKLEIIPAIMREAVEACEETRFDRSHFKAYGNFSLNFETVYFVLTADYNRYMDVQQAVNLHIHQRFEEEGIEFAYPTQTLFIESPAS
ncbi:MULTISPECIES: mechanosensitive ion channel family protein [unclassified Guyparkeria]|uniref:mechanosensitive ion channel family protein n=1 Tax=unclassified Guyparkeria TaxID=2626246 RepID=UPI0007337D24|nr:MULTISPECIES: mechanosensitive ion channel family protein [unclassified Guyparkeria]KTG17554.1 mechanosensitive ion channel protein MscS [Guyparkeria sp. XI15]OAE88368.1 mechanosensitive ion channel protein MscS [Guyparkeria sp. WRN-7]